MMAYGKKEMAKFFGGTTGTGSPGDGTGGAIPPYSATGSGTTSGGSGGGPPPTE